MGAVRRVVLAAIGSEGDVAPLVSIGTALQRRGHRVSVVALRQYAGPVTDAGLDLEAVDAGESPLWSPHPVLRGLALAQHGVLYAMMRARFRHVAPHTNGALLRVGADADVLVSGTATRGACQVLAAATGARHVSVLYAPLLPAERPESTCLCLPGLGPRVAYATSRLMWILTQGLGAAHTRDMRRRIRRGDTRLGRTGPAPGQAPVEEMLLASSPVVTPPSPRWPDTVEQAGWVRSTLGRPGLPPDVQEFLAAGPPPVVMTFGSSLVADPARDRDLFVRAARHAGRRLLVPGVPPEHHRHQPDVLFTGAMDFARLLPQVAAIVHHGGAGTTYTALAAGVPSVVVPHLGDQGYYGRQVARLGAGPRPVPRWRLTARGLGRLVEEAVTMAPGARAVATRLGDADGAERIADRIASTPSA